MSTTRRGIECGLLMETTSLNDLQFECSRQVGDTVRGRDDEPLPDEGTSALELDLGGASDGIAQIGQPGILAQLSILAT